MVEENFFPIACSELGQKKKNPKKEKSNSMRCARTGARYVTFMALQNFLFSPFTLPGNAPF